MERVRPLALFLSRIVLALALLLVHLFPVEVMVPFLQVTLRVNREEVKPLVPVFLSKVLWTYVRTLRFLLFLSPRGSLLVSGIVTTRTFFIVDILHELLLRFVNVDNELVNIFLFVLYYPLFSFDLFLFVCLN